MYRALLVLLLAAACGRSGPEYPTCDDAEDCETPAETEASCLEGDEDFRFCAWECDVDADCEQADDWRRVCATFQSEAGQYCLPSCQQDPESEDEACPSGFICRATGGGSPRRVCYPG